MFLDQQRPQTCLVFFQLATFLKKSHTQTIGEGITLDYFCYINCKCVCVCVYRCLQRQTVVFLGAEVRDGCEPPGAGGRQESIWVLWKTSTYSPDPWFSFINDVHICVPDGGLCTYVWMAVKARRVSDHIELELHAILTICCVCWDSSLDPVQEQHVLLLQRHLSSHP